MTRISVIPELINCSYITLLSALLEHPVLKKNFNLISLEKKQLY